MTDRAGRARSSGIAAAALLTLGATAPAELELTFDNVHGARGQFLVCVTSEAAHFPDCAGDPAAVKRIAAATSRTLRLTVPRPGSYAVSVLHDANANGRIDKTLGIPREGFGFSRNPAIRFGPPSFADTVVDLGPGLSHQTVRMVYVF